jgi:translation initiation factor eIF-2B subunit epsilon
LNNETLTIPSQIIADSFETKFQPFSLSIPRCLLPVANTPLIEYTLEFLANAGVEEVFVYVGSHTEAVESYINASRWKGKSSPFSSVEIVRTAASSVGDVMRDIDQKGRMTGDFVLVQGDVVANMPLGGALAAHRERRLKDKNAIMTMVLREGGRAGVQRTTPVFFIDPAKDRVLHYEQISPKGSLAGLPGANEEEEGGRYAHLDSEILTSCEELDVRHDLVDTSIDICTPDVLALWTEGFDYHLSRREFLFGVLKDYQLNGKTFHTHIISEHYAARVKNLASYVAVSRDIVNRWAYPIGPDSNLVPDQSFTFQRGNVYKENHVILARSCIVKRNTVIGQDTSIGDGTVVGNSVIGRRCQIGKNVTINGAFIWDDVSIGDNTVVGQAIVAGEVNLGKGVVVEDGAMIGYAVTVAHGITVGGEKRLVKGLQGGVRAGYSDEKVVGAGGDGYDMEPEEDDDDEVDTVESSRFCKFSLSFKMPLSNNPQYTPSPTSPPPQNQSRPSPPQKQTTSNPASVPCP